MLPKDSSKKNSDKKPAENQELPPKTVQKERKPFTSSSGIVYIGHIPHGFYESQMKQFFKQFGRVKRVRVARSKMTGRSRGYGYVEFEFPEVAKIAAETMNNYLMCGRLLKSSFIPPDKQHGGFFSGKSWSARKYPGKFNRALEKKINRSEKSSKNNEKLVKRTTKKLDLLQERMKQAGISLELSSVVSK